MDCLIGETLHVRAEPELQHLNALVDALVASGNSLTDDGFVPSPAGWVCHFALPLDATVVRTFIETDSHDVVFVEADDSVHCCHCWGAVIGARA